MTKPFVVTLPWPPHELSPNARTHWAQKGRIVKKCRYVASIATRESFAKSWFEFDRDKVKRVSVELIFTPPDKRARDEDNLIASMKPFMDGVAESLNINDKRFHYREITITKPKRPGVVSALITIEVEDETAST